MELPETSASQSYDVSVVDSSAVNFHNNSSYGSQPRNEVLYCPKCLIRIAANNEEFKSFASFTSFESGASYIMNGRGYTRPYNSLKNNSEIDILDNVVDICTDEGRSFLITSYRNIVPIYKDFSTLSSMLTLNGNNKLVSNPGAEIILKCCSTYNHNLGILIIIIKRVITIISLQSISDSLFEVQDKFSCSLLSNNAIISCRIWKIDSKTCLLITLGANVGMNIWKISRIIGENGVLMWGKMSLKPDMALLSDHQHWITAMMMSSGSSHSNSNSNNFAVGDAVGSVLLWTLPPPTSTATSSTPTSATFPAIAIANNTSTATSTTTSHLLQFWFEQRGISRYPITAITAASTGTSSTTTVTTTADEFFIGDARGDIILVRIEGGRAGSGTSGGRRDSTRTSRSSGRIDNINITPVLRIIRIISLHATAAISRIDWQPNYNDNDNDSNTSSSLRHRLRSVSADDGVVWECNLNLDLDMDLDCTTATATTMGVIGITRVWPEIAENTSHHSLVESCVVLRQLEFIVTAGASTAFFVWDVNTGHMVCSGESESRNCTSITAFEQHCADIGKDTDTVGKDRNGNGDGIRECTLGTCVQLAFGYRDGDVRLYELSPILIDEVDNDNDNDNEQDDRMNNNNSNGGNGNGVIVSTVTDFIGTRRSSIGFSQYKPSKNNIHLKTSVENKWKVKFLNKVHYSPLPVMDVHFSSCGDHIIISHALYNIIIHNLNTGRAVMQFQLDSDIIDISIVNTIHCIGDGNTRRMSTRNNNGTSNDNYNGYVNSNGDGNGNGDGNNSQNNKNKNNNSYKNNDSNSECLDVVLQGRNEVKVIDALKGRVIKQFLLHTIKYEYIQRNINANKHTNNNNNRSVGDKLSTSTSNASSNYNNISRSSSSTSDECVIVFTAIWRIFPEAEGEGNATGGRRVPLLLLCVCITHDGVLYVLDEEGVCTLIAAFSTTTTTTPTPTEKVVVEEDDDDDENGGGSKRNKVNCEEEEEQTQQSQEQQQHEQSPVVDSVDNIIAGMRLYGDGVSPVVLVWTFRRLLIVKLNLSDNDGDVKETLRNWKPFASDNSIEYVVSERKSRIITAIALKSSMQHHRLNRVQVILSDGFSFTINI